MVRLPAGDLHEALFIFTFFILMDYPIHIDTISIVLSILYLKGLPVKISINDVHWISVPEDCFYLSKLCRP